jgi:benzoyl-CoA reductase subunit C
MKLSELIGNCEAIVEDLDLGTVARWKAAHPGCRAIGYLPTLFPREVPHSLGMLPVGILGAGEELEIVRGDACFQSYICHLPRSVIELGLSGRLGLLDGMVFPSTCDVIRNLSGIWRLTFPHQYVKYFDVPQNFDSEVGGAFYVDLLNELWRELAELSGTAVDASALRASIRAHNAHRELVRVLYDLRATEPWRVPTSEAYLLLRAGMVLPLEEHTRWLTEYLALARAADRRPLDNARVVVTGAFCEQPPLALIRTLERAGCYVVDDDLLPVFRWLGSSVRDRGDPIEALSEAYLAWKGESASRYVPDRETKGSELVESVRRSGAEGVIFAAPSFCDPALLDRPMLQEALDRAGITHTSFQYSENSGQMQPIREQAGGFADSIKLWSDR